MTIRNWRTQIDKSAQIWKPTTILKRNRRIFIGPECRIGQYCFIAARKLTMERGAELSPHAVLGGGGDIYMCRFSTVDYGARLIPATFTTKGKYMNDAIMAKEPEKVDIIRGSIRLEEGAVIGANAVVCVSRKFPNITIGKHSVIGALSYIDSNVPDHTVIHPLIERLWKMRQ